MADIVEDARWEGGVRLIEKSDKVLGGAEGVVNVQAQQLANRTAWLKREVEKRAGAGDLTQGLGGKADKAHGHQISDVNGLTAALAEKVGHSGGYAILEAAGNYGGLEVRAQDGKYRFEREGRQFKLWYGEGAGTPYAINFPAKAGTVALLSDLSAGLGGKANSAHRHSMSDIDGLSAALGAYLPLTGGRLTGNLSAPFIRADGQYMAVTVSNAEYGGFEITRSGNNGDWRARIEATPDKRWKFWTEGAHDIFLPPRAGTVALEGEVVPKNSDSTINGLLRLERGHSWLTVKSTGNPSASLDYTVSNGKHPQASFEAFDRGGHAVDFRFHATPPGNSYEQDRRRHVATVANDGNLWSLAYGWLHDFFAKQSDINRVWSELNNSVMRRGDFVRSWYPNHYAGTEVYKIRHLGLMITVMNTNAQGGQELILPEAYEGHAIVLATDRGTGNVGVESNYLVANNKVRVGGRGDTSVSVLVIGQRSNF